jgi:hypothetical protein
MIKDMRPHVAIRDGNYITRGYHKDQFKIPEKFTLFDVVNDSEEKNELSKMNVELFNSMKSKLIKMYKDVNQERQKQ